MQTKIDGVISSRVFSQTLDACENLWSILQRKNLILDK